MTRLEHAEDSLRNDGRYDRAYLNRYVSLQVMWTVVQHRKLRQQLGTLPPAVLERYAMWVDVVRQSGPEGLRLLPGVSDESLTVEWVGHRSSRLGIRYRVIYRIEREDIRVLVMKINADD